MSVSGERICRLAEAAAASSDPEQSLQTLMELREELREFERQQVARALTAGRSYGAVARAMGISRQAAHRRFSDLRPRRRLRARRTPPTPEVRLVVAYAREAAKRLEATGIAPEHVLLGILRNGDRYAAAALAATGVTFEDVQRAARAAPRSTDGNDDLRAVLAESVRCAGRADAERVEVQHLLEGMLRRPDGRTADLLSGLGVTAERVLDALRRSVA